MHSSLDTERTDKQTHIYWPVGPEAVSLCAAGDIATPSAALGAG